MDARTLKLDSLSLTDIIRLQNQLSQILTLRFERQSAIVFSDIVDSSEYFSKFGDEAGGRLQQQHFDLTAECLTGSDGKILDTAGDGILLAFPTVQSAADLIIKFRMAHWNLVSRIPQDQHWTTRAALHWGPVLTDGVMIAGDTVNVCSKIMAQARPGAVLLSKRAFSELPTDLRAICRSIGQISLGGPDTMELFRMSWHELFQLPVMFLVEQTGERIFLPDKPVISLGRSQATHGNSANDIVLRLHDEYTTNQISRWHLQLRRQPTGLMAYSLSDKATHVDGRLLLKGEASPVTIGTKICLSNVITLHFLSLPEPAAPGDTTITH